MWLTVSRQEFARFKEHEGCRIEVVEVHSEWDKLRLDIKCVEHNVVLIEVDTG